MLTFDTADDIYIMQHKHPMQKLGIVEAKTEHSRRTRTGLWGERLEIGCQKFEAMLHCN